MSAGRNVSPGGVPGPSRRRGGDTAVCSGCCCFLVAPFSCPIPCPAPRVPFRIPLSDAVHYLYSSIRMCSPESNALLLIFLPLAFFILSDTLLLEKE